MSRSRQISAVSSIITAELVVLVIEVIDVSGVAEQLESFLERRTARRRTIPVRALFVALLRSRSTIVRST